MAPVNILGVGTPIKQIRAPSVPPLQEMTHVFIHLLLFKIGNVLKVTINNFPGIQLEKFRISLEKIL